MFLPARRPLAIALLVAGAFFMENLDGTVIATAMPQMARSFGASPVDLKHRHDGLPAGACRVYSDQRLAD